VNNWRNRHFFLLDLILLPTVVVLAFAVRLPVTRLPGFAVQIAVFALVSVPIKLLTFRALGLYSRYWQYAGIDDALLIAVAATLGGMVSSVLIFGLLPPLTGIAGCPRSIPLIDALLTIAAVAGTRFTWNKLWHTRSRVHHRWHSSPTKRVLIMGAGSAGTLILKEIHDNPQMGLVPIGLVDDDPTKHGLYIHGVRVIGDRERIPALVQKLHVDEVIVAMPGVPGSVVREILDICRNAGVPTRSMPGLYDIVSGRIQVSQLREIEIEDLLRREPVRIDDSAVDRMLRGRRVLVTGAGGSIGGELCHQIARCGPALLVLLGHGEHSIYQIHQALRSVWPDLAIRPVVADLKDPDRLRQVFEALRPEVVFHAAAHKHVPLMEQNIPEAVLNNVKGTDNLLRISEECRVSRLVLISSDKAVNPTSVMGATKRISEQLVQLSAARTRRPYVAVRFGNVLGSRGSVVPLFRQQIARGGPITVTHPDMRRYFMTIPEAVLLVLQAATFGQGGEVFVLDMGEPVRIVDLATDLIRLSGLRPIVRWPDREQPQDGDWDIEVVFAGLRAGEKLFEELSVEGEQYLPTCHEKIVVLCNGDCGHVDLTRLERRVGELVELAWRGTDEQLQAKMREIVPEYTPASLCPPAPASDPRSNRSGNGLPSAAAETTMVPPSFVRRRGEPRRVADPSNQRVQPV